MSPTDARTGLAKLQRQLGMMEIRITRQWEVLNTHFLAIVKGDLSAPEIIFQEEQSMLMDLITLDCETYYTVGADLLKLVRNEFLTEHQRQQFKSEVTYKSIQRLCNELVRHAFEAQGDPYGDFSVDEALGPKLKGGSPHQIYNDPGFFSNCDALSKLLDKYNVPRFYLSDERQKRLREIFKI